MPVKITYTASLPKNIECLVAFVIKGNKSPTLPPVELPQPLKELASRAIKSGLFKVKQEECFVAPVDTKGIARFLMVGMSSKPTNEQLKRASGKAGAVLANMGIESACLLVPSDIEAKAEALVAFTEGAVLGSYQFEQYKKPAKGEDKKTKLKQITVSNSSLKNASALVQVGQVRANGICLARDLGNQPGNMLTPTILAKEAIALAKKRGLSIKVLDKKALEKEKMGLLLGVSQGSIQPPSLIVLEYRNPKAKQTIAFVGKGVTFDTGGISLKPSPKMDEMKFDMCGAAAVLGSMDAIAQLKPAVNVIGVIPASENMPSSQATKPGDIHTCCDGTTVEILNTDAEGRLILADAIAWTVKQFKPDAIVDLATLTGACLVALGKYVSGAVNNSEPLQERVLVAGQLAGERIWPLPNFPEYELDLKSKYADIQNIGGRYAGTITAGLFIKKFVGKTAWVHLDIAGTAWDVQNIGYIPNTGATGVGVATLTELALNWKAL